MPEGNLCKTPCQTDLDRGYCWLPCDVQKTAGTDTTERENTGWRQRVTERRTERERERENTTSKRNRLRVTETDWQREGERQLKREQEGERD